MSGSRTKTGCLSCRIRRKKCDEGKPFCLACSSRNIQCLGYDVKPDWMMGFRSWQEVLESDMAKAIRKSAERNYNLRRARQRRSNHQPGAVLDKPGRPLSDSDETCLVNSTTWSTMIPFSDSIVAIDNIWWDSNIHSASGSSSLDFRNVMYFLEIICPLQFGFSSLYYHPNYDDHKWFVNTIMQDEPLYHAANALSLCFEAGSQDGNTSGFCDASVLVLKSKDSAIRGLQTRVDELVVERQHCTRPPISLVSRILATVMHLSSLEVFNSLGGNWEVHLNAAGTMLGLLQQSQLSRVPGSSVARPEKDPIREALAGQILPEEERKSFAFFIATFVWTDIMTRASTTRLKRKKEFQYTSLLQENLIDPSIIMGCHGTIMTAIANINALEAWRDEMSSRETANPATLLAKASAIEFAIKAYLRKARNIKTFPSPNRAKADSEIVTIIHAHAALIYLYVAISQNSIAKFGMNKVKEHVRHCLQEFETLPSRLFIRICWPFAVAGSMAGDEDEQARFRALISRVVSERQVLGFTWKALIVMEECWRLRQCHGDVGARAWSWKTTMEHMGLRVLFI
ncbi:fungal-specific transcription factor domain-containing protein [Xylariaceae sp. FL0255]|nr:fungal-specific transcription factor domain-containing protein [Xylariaceae sp. FL0255]